MRILTEGGRNMRNSRLVCWPQLGDCCPLSVLELEHFSLLTPPSIETDGLVVPGSD